MKEARNGEWTKIGKEKREKYKEKELDEEKKCSSFRNIDHLDILKSGFMLRALHFLSRRYKWIIGDKNNNLIYIQRLTVVQ